MAEMTLAQQVQEQLASLKQALIESNPGMPQMLRTIHTHLRNDKDIVTLLSPEEVGVVVSGLMKQSNTVIAVATVKKSKSTKALKAITIDDL